MSALLPACLMYKIYVSYISQQRKILTLHSGWRMTLNCQLLSFFRKLSREKWHLVKIKGHVIHLFFTFKICPDISLDRGRAIYLCDINSVFSRITVTVYLLESAKTRFAIKLLKLLTKISSSVSDIGHCMMGLF